MAQKTFCEECGYEFKFPNHDHNPEYCTCGGCMMDSLGVDNLYRMMGKFRYEEVDE